MGSVHGDLCCFLLLETQECLLPLCGHQPLALRALTCHPWSPQIVLVISRCPWLACGKDSLLSLGMLSLGMLSPQTAAALLWGSAHSLLLTETRPLTLLWTLSTSNQLLLLVFDISWENHQEALVVVFSPFFKISITFSALLPTLCLVCVAPCAPSRDPHSAKL